MGGRIDKMGKINRFLGAVSGREKRILSEIRDIVDVVKRECKSFEDLMYRVQVVRTRPYSRLSAFINSADLVSIKDFCTGKWEEKDAPLEVYEYLLKLGVCWEGEMIVVYRGGSKIKAGDWVALEYEYARWHGYPVYKKLVRLDEVLWAGTYEKEWYYVPWYLIGYFKDYRDFWETVKRYDC